MTPEETLVVQLIGAMLSGRPHGVALGILLDLVTDVMLDADGGDEAVFATSIRNLTDALKVTRSLKQAEGATRQ